MHIKNIYGEKSHLFDCLCFCAFCAFCAFGAFGVFWCFFVFLVLLVHFVGVKFFRKKKIKSLKML